MEKSSPVKIRKFLPDKREGSTDILISDDVNIDPLQCSDMNFEREALVPGNVNLSMLCIVSPNQLLTGKAKIVNLQEPELVSMGKPMFKKMDAFLIDQHGSVNIILWEGDIFKVKEGGTYEFHNIRVKKSKYNQEVYVNPAKNDSSITECSAFEGQFAVPENVPAEFTSTDIKGEILGLSVVQLDHNCINCNKRVKLKVDRKIATCENVNGRK